MEYVKPQLTLVGSTSGVVLGFLDGDTDLPVGDILAALEAEW
jgi:hypothetical protein